jgi:iron complex transport system substrate-binding protein
VSAASRPARRRVPGHAPTALLALVATALLAACSAGAGSTPAPTLAPYTPVPSVVAPSSTPVPLFPATLTDDEGTPVTLKAQPTKIVSLTPAATETLFALGVGDRLVGKVEDFTPFPSAAATVPDVAKYGSVDVEKIVGLGADLVIAGGNNFNPPDSITKLRSLGVPVLVLYAPDVKTALADLGLIGSAVGRPTEAAALGATIRATFDGVAAAVATLDQPRVY